MVRILHFKNFLLIGGELANFVPMFRHLAPSLWIPAAIFSLALALMYAIWPSGADEIWYMMDLRHYTSLAGGSVAAGIFDSMVYHSEIDNIRLCNILYMCSLALPEWADWLLLWGALGIDAALYFRPRVSALYERGAVLPMFSVRGTAERVPAFGPVNVPFGRPALNLAWSHYRELSYTGWCCDMASEYHHGVRAAYLFILEELEYVTARSGEAAGADLKIVGWYEKKD